MATTIKSTNLDFDSIKNNLKTFFQQQSEFEDYDFEASGLSNILDVLAYNTHYNGLIANFALNESFLNTAQLRSSLVSLSEGLGYVPKSRTSSQATVKIVLDLTTAATLPAIVSVAAGTRFTATVDEVAYTFQTREKISATSDGTGIYVLKNTSGEENIQIFEGTNKVRTFVADKEFSDALYVIPDKTIDTETAIVRVYESPSASVFATYTDIRKATIITETSTLYILRESPNGFYELTFGDGTTLGLSPKANFKIEVDYLSVVGAAANSASVFTPVDTYLHEGVNYNFSVTTVTKSVGGDSVETLNSIRKNAPFLFASQNRMVVAKDYSTLILRNFSTLIKDIQSFGGQDSLEPEFGSVHVSIVFNDDVSATKITDTKSAIQDLVNELSVLSFRIRFVDPVKTFIETQTFFQFNPKLTTLSLNTVSNNAQSVVDQYFVSNTGKFNQSFRRSNVLTLIDETNPAVLSSRMNVKMQQRITPALDKKSDFLLRFPVPIAKQDDENYIISSSLFIIGDKTCEIKNLLGSTKLQAINVVDQSVVIDNLGTFFPTDAKIQIVGLKVAEIVGGLSYIKIKAVPANQSVISPKRQDIIEHDPGESFSEAVIVDTE